jgi:hypothetical protein
MTAPVACRRRKLSLEELAPGRTRFTYSVAIEPRRALSMAGPIARTRIDSLLRNV